MRRAPDPERILVRSGIRLFWFWFPVRRAGQSASSRNTSDPLKCRKLSLVEVADLDRWDKLIKAEESMFFDTDTAGAPWTIIKADDRRRARSAARICRVTCLRLASRRGARYCGC